MGGVTHDLIIVGGGLSGGLLAWRLAERRPELRLRLVETDQSLGGNHTWSFHASDLTRAERAWIDPLVAHRWPGHDVAFDGFSRGFDTPYLAISSAGFDQAIRARLGTAVMCGTRVSSLAADHVRLADGAILSAGAVIDATGAGPTMGFPCAWQNFLGQELRFAAPHGLTRPLLMDARVEQLDGFRFVYVLPLGPDTALVEDTYYADRRGIDAGLLRARIAAYVAARGWRTVALLREESGSLPIPLAGPPMPRPDRAGPVRIGMRAGLAHATTGYTLPEAVRLADRIAALPVISADSLASLLARHQARCASRQRFFHLVNRMLFLAAAPADRHRAMARFYRLPDRVIRHFYAGRLDAADKARILVGRPPVPFFAGLRAAFGDGTRPTVPLPPALP